MSPKQEKSPQEKQSWYASFAESASMIAGKAWVFSLAVALIVIWMIVGLIINFKDPWREVMGITNGITNVLLLLLVQNTQNRGNEAMQVKLNELISVIQDTDKTLMDLEDLDEEDVKKVKKRYERLAEKARQTDGNNIE